MKSNKDNFKRMGKPLLAKELGKRLDVNLDVANDVLETLIETLIYGIDTYDKVDLCGFLTIEKTLRDDYTVTLKGETFNVESKYYVKAKMREEFKKMNSSGKYSKDQREKAVNRYKKR